MFTGIAAAMGSVRRLTRRGEDALLEIDTSLDLGDVRIGDSIAVSGACLTVTALGGGGFTADVSAETLSRTTLGDSDGGRPGQPGEGPARRRSPRGAHRPGPCGRRGNDPWRKRPAPDRSSSALRSIRGSAGISSARDRSRWTASASPSTAVKRTVFYVNIIPHTAAGTTLGIQKGGGAVNIETDILARYLEKLISGGEGDAAGAAGAAGSSRTGEIDLDYALPGTGFLK